MYRILMYGGLIIAFVCLVLSIIFFFRDHVAKLLGDVTGWNARKAIRKIDRKGTGELTKTEAIHQDVSKVLVKHAATTRTMLQGNTGQTDLATDVDESLIVRVAGKNTAEKEEKSIFSQIREIREKKLQQKPEDKATDVLHIAEEDRPTDVLHIAEEDQPTDVLHAEEDQPTDVLYTAEEDRPTDILYAAEEDQPTDVLYTAEEDRPTDVLYAAEGDRPTELLHTSGEGDEETELLFQGDAPTQLLQQEEEIRITEDGISILNEQIDIPGEVMLANVEQPLPDIFEVEEETTVVHTDEQIGIDNSEGE